MKTIGGIFSFLLLLVAIQPAFEYILVEKDGICCESACAPVSDEQGASSTDNEGNDLCNPFMQCSSCVMFVNALTSLVPKSGVPNTQIKQFYSYKVNSQFFNDFWHPPKIG